MISRDPEVAQHCPSPPDARPRGDLRLSTASPSGPSPPADTRAPGPRKGTAEARIARGRSPATKPAGPRNAAGRRRSDRVLAETRRPPLRSSAVRLSDDDVGRLLDTLDVELELNHAAPRLP